jgi:hypothetical protein
MDPGFDLYMATPIDKAFVAELNKMLFISVLIKAER